MSVSRRSPFELDELLDHPNSSPVHTTVFTGESSGLAFGPVHAHSVALWISRVTVLCLMRATRRTKKETLRSLLHRTWSGKRDSNSRPQPWQGCALPTELFPLGRRHSTAAAAGVKRRCPRPRCPQARASRPPPLFMERRMRMDATETKKGAEAPFLCIPCKPVDFHGHQPGAGNETRTRDLNLGKVALYQLSYSRLGGGILPVFTRLSTCSAALLQARTFARGTLVVA